MAALYDGLRVDHVIGLYRTYCRPGAGDPFFNPEDERSQIEQGEAVLTVLQECGVQLVAEDLGSVPEFLRPSLDRLRIPGSKVLRWERRWRLEGTPFIDPCEFSPLSTAMTGTHDVEPLAVWWGALEPSDRMAQLRLPIFIERGLFPDVPAWSIVLRDTYLESAYQAGSDGVYFPIQDLFGWSDRINVPGTVAASNWRWSLPWPVDRWADVPEAVERATVLRRLARESGRFQR
jgi:4-alpha-glucanotransferase